MINKDAKLSKDIFEKGGVKKSLRDGFGGGLVLAGEKDKRVVALTADLMESTRVKDFFEKFPERSFDVGVAEGALVTVASGMANYGKIPFASSYAAFSPGRTWEQIRTTIAINNVPVKLIGAHSGLEAAPYGSTHQGLEDIALMRVLPNMIVVVPCDWEEAKKATLAIAKNDKPTYLRLTRQESKTITTEDSPFKVGRAETLWESKNPQVAIIACGQVIYQALLSAKALEKTGIEVLVINSHTVKPLDEGAIIKAAKITGAVVTVEDHQVAGGLGSAVSEVLSKNFPVPMEFIGVKDIFGGSGKTVSELWEKHGLKASNITSAVMNVIKRKNS